MYVCIYYVNQFFIWADNAPTKNQELTKFPLLHMRNPLLSCWSRLSKRLLKYYRLLLLSLVTQPQVGEVPNADDTMTYQIPELQTVSPETSKRELT